MKKSIQYATDLVKRKVMDGARRLGRLKTPMDIILLSLDSFRQLPEDLVALEVFGMYGLWHTRDYSVRCSYLEIYEWDPVYFKMLGNQYPAATCVNANSIEAITEKKLLRKEYNFIVVDNPIGEEFGKGYFEHFDLFDGLIEYTARGGVIILNFILHRNEYINNDSLKARRAFYGKEFPTIEEAVKIYEGKINKQNRDLSYWHYIPRNSKLGYLCLILG